MILKKSHEKSIITRLHARSELANNMFDQAGPHFYNSNMKNSTTKKKIVVLQVLELDKLELLVEFVHEGDYNESSKN